MIILRKYKSVVFLLVFVSLWIVGFLPCCNEKKNDGTEEKSTSGSSELNNSNYNNDNNNNYQLPPSNTGYYQNMDINHFPNQNPNQNQNVINYIISPQISLNEPGPISTYSKPTLIGLNNIGATCFMNSTLQCLSQTRGLANYFLKASNENKIMNNNIAQEDPSQPQLTPSFLKLIKNLWSKTRTKPYSPDELVDTIGQINPSFKQGDPGDSKDFIIFILEQIHAELNGPIKKMQNNLNRIEPFNQYDKNNAFNHFFEDFQKQCSIITDVFFGFIETNTICQVCQHIYTAKGLSYPISYNYQIFNCLIFPLEEVKNMKNTKMNIFTTNNVVTINDCFMYYQKTDFFQGQNQTFCSLCKQLRNATYTTRIFSSPNNLILILNRGKGKIYDIKLDFTETIDITQFILQKDRPQIIYNLYGVITHIGQSGPDAHFVASCKSPVDNYWYRYNDSIVSRITNVQKEIIDFGTPYILFYERQNL